MAVATPAGPLTLLSDIASRLAEGGDIVATVADVIQRLQRALDASEVSLWLDANGSLGRFAFAGSPSITAAAIAAALEGQPAAGDIRVRQLVSRGQRIGVLATVRNGEVHADADAVLAIVANLLAPELAHAGDVHRLTDEVERSARQVEAERLLMASIIDALPLGLYVVDREYRVQAWNSNRELGTQGVSREHAIGKLIFEVLHRQPADELRAGFDEVLRTGQMQQFNIDSSASGSARTYRISKIPMRLGNGAVSHVISIGEDITEWQAAQERWAQSEKLAAIGQLAAGIMHEISNPLATIAACAASLSLQHEDLRRAGVQVPERTDEFTRLIEQEVQRCKRIIDGLLTFARPQSGEKRATDLNAVVEQTLFLVRHHARFRQIRVKTVLAPDLEQVPANFEQLIQVVMALLINAADAMNETGTLAIRTRRGSSDAEAVIVEVIDDGAGIPRGELARIFEPFYTTKPPGRGTGLGLSICYSIIDGHGGRIEVDSAVGAGSTFRILLPNANAPARTTAGTLS